MDLESRLAVMVGRAKKLKPGLSGLLSCEMSPAGLSETEKYLIGLCADIVEKQDCSRESALMLVRSAKAVLAKRTANGKLVKERIGWVLKRNCYSVAVRCLGQVEAATANGEEIGTYALKDVYKLAGKVSSPPLARFLKGSLESASERTKNAEVLPSLLFDHAVSKSPVFSVWTGLKRSPGGQFVLNVLVTLVLIAAIIWLHAPPPAFTAVLLASIVHMVYIWRTALPESSGGCCIEKQLKDPVFWYSRIEEALRKKPKGYGKELPGMLSSFTEALRVMPSDKTEESRRIARNFRRTILPRLRAEMEEKEYVHLDGVLESLGNPPSAH